MTKRWYAAVLIVIGVISCENLTNQTKSECYSSISQNDCGLGQLLDLDLDQSPCPRCRGGLGKKALSIDRYFNMTSQIMCAIIIHKFPNTIFQSR